jgi:hypothetical protein
MALIPFLAMRPFKDLRSEINRYEKPDFLVASIRLGNGLSPAQLKFGYS